MILYLLSIILLSLHQTPLLLEQSTLDKTPQLGKSKYTFLESIEIFEIDSI